MSETSRMDKARFHGSIYEGRDVLVAIPLPTSQAQRIWEEGCKLERELTQAQARCAEQFELLKECRKWQADGDYGDPLGPDCWTPVYASFMARLDAALKKKT